MFRRVIGFIWASPVTTVGLFLIGCASALRWCEWLGRKGDALVWVLGPRAPKKLDVSMAWLGGVTLGNVVVLRSKPNTPLRAMVLRHEQEHVRQYMVLGVLQPLLFIAAYAGLSVCMHSHPFYDNPFEIDARRAAGQTVDVIGAVKRAIAQGKLKAPDRK